MVFILWVPNPPVLNINNASCKFAASHVTAIFSRNQFPHPNQPQMTGVEGCPCWGVLFLVPQELRRDFKGKNLMDASPTRVYPNVHKSSPWASAVLGFHHTVPFLSCQMLRCSPPQGLPPPPPPGSPPPPPPPTRTPVRPASCSACSGSARPCCALACTPPWRLLRDMELWVAVAFEACPTPKFNPVRNP